MHPNPAETPVPKKSLLGLVFGLLSLGTAPAFAARPFATDDAGTVATGRYELELAAEAWEDSAEMSLGFKHGVTESMDLSLACGYAALPQIDAQTGPLELGVKYSLLPERLACSAAAAFGTQDYALNLIWTAPLGPLTVNTNLGFETASDLSENLLTCQICGVVNAGFLELGAEIGGTQKGLAFWTAGAKYAWNESLALDAGIRGEWGEEAEVRATAGMSLSFQPRPAATGEK